MSVTFSFADRLSLCMHCVADEDDSYILRRKLQELSNVLAEKDSKIQELKGKIRTCEEVPNESV